MYVPDNSVVITVIGKTKQNHTLRYSVWSINVATYKTKNVLIYSENMSFCTTDIKS